MIKKYMKLIIFYENTSLNLKYNLDIQDIQWSIKYYYQNKKYDHCKHGNK